MPCPKNAKMTNAEYMCQTMLETAQEGSVKAFAAVRDTIGEKPKEETGIDLTGGITIKWEEPKCSK